MDFQVFQSSLVYKIQQQFQVCSNKSPGGNQSACLYRCSYSELLQLGQMDHLDLALWVLTGESLHICDDLGTLETSGSTARDGNVKYGFFLGLYLLYR